MKSHEESLEHAEWRVNFLRSMLTTHRVLPPMDKEWKEKEADLAARLQAAEIEWERLRMEGRECCQ